jgi:hypothetical protein
MTHLLLEGRLFLDVIDRWKRIEACNYNKEVHPTFIEKMKSLNCDGIRNLSITPGDDGCMGLTAREVEEFP